MNLHAVNVRVTNIFLFILSVSFLLLFAFYNRYPIIFSDVGTYIYSGFHDIVPVDRPIFYGIFVRHISLAFSLWLVAFAQSILVVLLIVYTIRYIFDTNFVYFKTFICCVLLSLTTSTSYVVSHIMPDFFLSILLLAIALLLLNKRLPILLKIFFAIIIIYACISHLSNVVVSVGIVSAIVLIAAIFRKKQFVRERFKNLILVIGIVASVWIVMPTLNYFFFDAEFTTSRTKNIFVMANLINGNVMKPYLKEYCDEKQYPLCDALDSLPDKHYIFLWESNSPLYDNCKNMQECWLQKDKEYGVIINDLLSVPKYRNMVIKQGLHNFVKQLYHFDMDGREHIREGHPSYSGIKSHFKDDFEYYRAARQAYRRIEFHTLSVIQRIVVAMSAVFLILALCIPSIRKLLNVKIFVFIGFVFLSLITNAFVCGTLSGVVNRYQNRIIWLLPFVAFIIVMNPLSGSKSLSGCDGDESAKRFKTA